MKLKFPHRPLTSIVSQAFAPFLAWGLISCASASFESTLDQKWQWDHGVEAESILDATLAAPVLRNIAGAVGITGRGLVGRTLPEGKLWTYEGPVDVLPTLVGDVVLFSGGGRVTMLDLRTGQERFSIDVHGRRLEGAGYDGTYSVLLLVDKDGARKDQIRVVNARGTTQVSARALARIGTPGAVNGIGLVPYGSQYIGAFELKTGRSLGRILLRDAVHTVTADEGKMWILGAGATPLSRKLGSAPQNVSLRLSPRKLPGEPPWPLDGSAPRLTRGSPVAIYAHPSLEDGVVRFSNSTYVATYFEVVLGLNPQNNRILWTTYFPHAVKGGKASSTGVTLCLENGSLWRLSYKDGTKEPFNSLETRVKGCVVTPSTEPIDTGKRKPLLAQIVETISGTGPDMAAMQRVLLQELGPQKGKETTLALLNIAQNPLVSADLSREAGALLRERKEGGESMIAALQKNAPPSLKPSSESSVEREHDPSHDEHDPHHRNTLRPPPVGDLAHALVRMKIPGAGSALAPYLLDPSHSSSQRKEIMSALGALGGKNELSIVQTFFETHKNTGGDKELLDALALALQFLLKNQNEEQNALLLSSVDDPLTYPALKKRLKALPEYATAKKQAVAPPHAPESTSQFE